MAVANIRFDLSQIEGGLRGLRRQGETVSSALRTARPKLRADLTAHASRQSGPEGAWPRRKDSRLDRRESRSRRAQRRRRSRPRRILGELPRTVTTRVRGLELQARSAVPWSGVHNEGGAVGRGSVLPPRPFVFLSDGFLRQAERTIAKHLIEGWQ